MAKKESLITVTLKRNYGDKSTIGEFTWQDSDNISRLYSLELPWKDNQRSISCIPEGEYIVEETYSPRFKKQMWEVLNVKDRSGIRMHVANYSRELEGCISLGLYATDLDGDGVIDVAHSKKAFDIARGALGKKFKLIITT